jgi:hypothetical protein
MGRRFSKTAAGRDEIKSRAHKITRTARNLLLIVDAARPGSDWVALIHGATPADLDLLLEQGLIEVAHVDAPGAERAAPARSMSEALGALSYDQLYGLLTSQARDRLGLFKGLKTVLEVEKCSGIADLQALAVRFVDMVRDAQGDGAAKQMRLALGMAA